MFDHTETQLGAVIDDAAADDEEDNRVSFQVIFSCPVTSTLAPSAPLATLTKLLFVTLC